MAKTAIPGPIERRHLIEGELDAGKALGYAEAYLAEGRAVEAVDFLRKAEDSERLAELREEAIRSGDAFLLRSVVAAAGVAAGPEEWGRLAEAAEAAGKERYAADARRQAGRGED